jgi:DNA polymerase III delta subunit
MLHLYYGTDTTAIRQRAFAAVDTLVTPGVQVTRLESSNFSVGMMANLLGATSLFGGTELYVLDTPSENSDFFREVASATAAMAESNNIFVIIEGALLAAERKEFEKHAAVCTEVKRPPQAQFDPFKMAEALSKKDKKSLWVLLQEAQQAGVSAEEIIGILWWQLKTLRVAAVTATADEAKMKSYPYDKAKRALRNFLPGELEKLAFELLRVYHDGHSGVRDINEGLEAWVLRG